MERMYCSWCNARIFEHDRTCGCCGAPTINPIIKTAVQEQGLRSRSKDVISYMEEFPMISETPYTLNFNIYDESRTDISNISGYLNWRLFEYGKPSETITQKKIFCSNGASSLELESDDTKKLNGKFVQELSGFLEDSFGFKFKISYSGIILILPRISCG